MAGYSKNYAEERTPMMLSDYDTLSDTMKRWCGWSQIRNVVDKYRGLTTEQIQVELKKNSLPYSVMFENILGDLNLSSCIRSANAFAARDFYYTGPKKKFDKRGCVGTHIYSPPTFIPFMDDVKALKQTYKFIAIDNLPGSVNIVEHQWEANTMIVFGEEGRGISDEMRTLCDTMVYIEQLGSIRSLNVGVAAGIVMNDIVNKFKVQGIK